MLRPLVLSTLLCVALACQQESREPEAIPTTLAGKNLIVITLDTSRRDHFSCYGDPELRGKTPAVDHLAADGALFLNGYSQTNTTNPSHAAIFTGLYALDLELMNNGAPFPVTKTGIDSLPAAFQRANYRTAAFPAIPHLAALDTPGFDESVPLQSERTARESVDRFLDWIERDATGPFFAWLHFFDPHVSYEPPERYREMFYSGDPTQGAGAKLSKIPEFNQMPPVAQEQFREVRDRTYPKAMYRGEIQYTDDQIGRLISQLRARGLYEDTAIVLVGDHGESLDEHTIYYNHQSLYEVSLRIPFILRLPGYPSGVRIAEPVSHVDLFPTLAQLFDLTIETERPLRGLSLVDALMGEPHSALAERDWLIHESAHNAEVAARRGPWKFIFRIYGRPGPSVQLFNLEEDPGEMNNVAEAHPEIVAELQPLVQRWIDRNIWGLATPKIEKTVADRLRALGYLPSIEEGTP